MRSGIIYYEYEKCENLKANAELGTFKIRRCHFDDESFVHPLHSIRFDLNRPYELPIKALMADQPLSSSCKGKSSVRGSHHSRQSSPMQHYSPKRSSSTRQVVSPSLTIHSSSLHRRVAGKTLKSPKIWELIAPSEGWMCEGDKEEKEIRGMEPSVEKKEGSEREEEEEDPKEEEEEEVLAATYLLMDIDATEYCILRL
ncbi:hypothetical protein PIB30_103610 [Stylosanthes scabra]|uniref:Uncharacterized protein n=1 Tax=Stylosanthes scabra TaxID=79078 RepID=A0ABU6WXP0_9FABA|nr:hypothetical protein [Stylosanthes scabra]